jgi:hypothetical protein
VAHSLDSTRLALNGGSQDQPPHGAWWPQSRSLSSQLPALFYLWPSGPSRIASILFSRPDWDDCPDAVQVPGRRIKTGSVARDDTHELTLVMDDGQHRYLTVIPPGTSGRSAGRILDKMAGDKPGHVTDGSMPASHAARD